MSQWTHAICIRCWVVLHGEVRVPVEMRNADEERCCWCGQLTTDGIYLRANPADLWAHTIAHREDS